MACHPTVACVAWERGKLGEDDAVQTKLLAQGSGTINWTSPVVEPAGNIGSTSICDHSLGMEANGLTSAVTHNGLVMNGSQTGSSGRSTPNDPAPGKLFVGGLSWQTTADKLREYFGQFGNVTDVLVMKDPVTQRSRGFGFITFSDPGSVDKVLKVPVHMLDNKKIDPKHATPKNKGKVNKTKKIFVGGVSQETSAEEVKMYFNQFGKVEEAVMLMDQQTKRHRGFGFVTFESEDVVDRVCEIHFHTIKNKKVECKKAQPKEAVVQANTLLGKRVVLGAIGSATAATQIAAAQAAQVQAAAAAAAAAQAQTVAGYSKFFGAYPTLASYRYTPYPVPTAAAVGATAASTAAAAAAGAPTLAQQVANPYQGYSLTNVDMSSFQGVDWGSMYGMGMYV